MTAAFKCNSCGEFYELAVGCVAINSYEVVVDESGGSHVVEEGTADLCASCGASFVANINHQPEASEHGEG